MLKKYLRILLIIYLSIYFSSCVNTRPPKPSFSVARALETKVYELDYNSLLKKSVNILQDMNYTVDVLNTDIGLITASRTTESKQAPLDDERTENDKPNILKIVVSLVIFSIIVGSFVYMIETIFNGDEDGDEDNNKEKVHRHNNNHYFTNDHDPSPIIYRYKVTINLNQLENKKTEVRVSASGETERNGKIISTGGIHEPEFFQKFFTQFDQGKF
tara:strand:- start:13842 stop:14489 length:648 start_codon:yes stop_codon:yes gene_type:complete